jgi:ABC-type uncharacterized transport system permease subunit
VQVLIHGTLLLTSALLILLRTILPGTLKPGPDAEPVFHILLTLVGTIGLPFFILAATSPLLQYWFSRLNTGREPYIFYSVSNIGSLLPLITYPIVIEPFLPLLGTPYK